jgi:glycosyltransferase involved in cell wall biosynthesis
MLRLTVTIITKNEEKNIGRCIDSVQKIADEIIVVDSFSTDATAEIASQKGAIVKQEKFRGYVEQKNLAVQLASNDFIFSLDADEMPDDELVDAILEIKMNPLSKAYTCNRLAYFCGKPIKHGLWYPGRKLRLFDRRVASWGGINPHDKVILAQAFSKKHLRGKILHYAYNSLNHYRQKSDHLTDIYIHSLHKIGRRTSLFKIIFNPFWEFVHGFILRLGFLDGYNGLIISMNTARYTFIKHFNLYQLQNEKFAFSNDQA